jgi:copper chaperone
MTKEKILIEGMSCNHCVMAVKRELSDAKINVEEAGIGFAKIEYDEKAINRETIKTAVEEAGFKYTGEESLN